MSSPAGHAVFAQSVRDVSENREERSEGYETKCKRSRVEEKRLKDNGETRDTEER